MDIETPNEFLTILRQNRLDAMRNGTVFAIHPRQEIYVWAYDGNGERFARLFKATLDRIPLGSRRRILKHWRDNQVPPQIELVEYWSRPAHQSDTSTLGSTNFHGHELKFWASAVDEMEDSAVCDLVAHELAHVFQFAQGMELMLASEGRGTHCDHFDNDRNWEEGVEFEADSICLEWGFGIDL